MASWNRVTKRPDSAPGPWWTVTTRVRQQRQAQEWGVAIDAWELTLMWACSVTTVSAGGAGFGRSLLACGTLAVAQARESTGLIMALRMNRLSALAHPTRLIVCWAGRRWNNTSAWDRLRSARRRCALPRAPMALGSGRMLAGVLLYLAEPNAHAHEAIEPEHAHCYNEEHHTQKHTHMHMPTHTHTHTHHPMPGRVRSCQHRHGPLDHAHPRVLDSHRANRHRSATRR